MRWPFARSGGLVVLALVVAWGCRDAVPPPALDLAAALRSGGDEGFAPVLEPIDFVFPRDHLPHPAQRTEWWYVVGHLEGSGRRFGFQATIFRHGVAPATAPRPSAWATESLWLGHLALSELDSGRFLSAQRLGRGSPSVGAQLAETVGGPPVTIALDDWSLAVGGDPFAATVVAHAQASESHQGVGFGLDLTLQSTKPLALHGERGFSRKGNNEGAASYYYAATRLTARGGVVVDGQVVPVVGSAWFDREWSTSLLEDNVAGWDWFAIQLADGRDLMAFELRRVDGSVAYRSGSLVGVDGAVQTLAASDLEIEVLDHWRSPLGTQYPARWRVEAPDGIAFEVVPDLADQEHRGTSRYWEGSVSALCAEVVCGRGYVELVGYARDAAGRHARR